MKKCISILIHFLLLFTTPLLFAHPQVEPIISNLLVSSTNECREERLLTYDDILEFVEEMELGDLEKYPEDELQWMAQLLVFLARNGVLPSQEEDAISLEWDIQDLLYDLNLHFSVNPHEDCTIVPAIFYGQRRIIPCNWFSKKWKHVKHFCKDHKKEIIIGSAIVVVAEAACLAAASAAETVNTLGTAGAAGAAALSNQSDRARNHKHSSRTVSKKKHASMRRSISHEIASAFQEDNEIKQSILLCDANDANGFARLQEAVRYAASKAAHGAVDCAATAASIIPALMDEGINARDRLLPDSLISELKLPRQVSDDDDEDGEETYMGKYQNDIANIHENIDKCCSTDLAKGYTPEAKAVLREAITLGILPPPQALKPGACGVVNAEGTYLPKTLASDTCGWQLGQDIKNRTRFGHVPKWDTVRKRYWRNRAEDIKSNPSLKPNYATLENIKRMERGLAPQQLNISNNRIESMELHHVPPRRDGGLFDFIELWPEEHAATDKFRRLGK